MKAISVGVYIGTIVGSSISAPFKTAQPKPTFG
jgi:hypothetical protein